MCLAVPFHINLNKQSIVKQIKVAFCTDGIYPHATGGMQKHSRLLIEQLAQYSSLSLTVLHPHEHAVFNNSAIKEVFIRPINPNLNYLRECYRYSQRIALELEKLDADVIYSQGLCVWAHIDRFRQRLIVNPHGLEPYQAFGFKNRLLAIPFKAVFNHIFSKAAAVVSLGGKLTDILLKRVSGPERVVVLPNGVNLPGANVCQSDEGERLRALFLARFASNKGIDILFSAIEQLHRAGMADQFEFVLGGKGPLYEYYRSRNKFNNVKLLGFVADEQISELYYSSNLFVLPTLFEGMPTVVLEAMAHGLPVIVTDVGATSELVGPENGYLIEKGAVSALVNALLSFAQLPTAHRIKMGQVSWEKVKQRFTWQSIAESHYHLFKKIADAGKA